MGGSQPAPCGEPLLASLAWLSPLLFHHTCSQGMVSYTFGPRGSAPSAWPTKPILKRKPCPLPSRRRLLRLPRKRRQPQPRRRPLLRRRKQLRKKLLLRRRKLLQRKKSGLSTTRTGRGDFRIRGGPVTT